LGSFKDYVKAMHLMINHTEPEDFVVSTMTTHSVREMVDYVFKRLGMDYRIMLHKILSLCDQKN
jgi:GDPmannose 4,6-dehydratase